MVYCVTLFGKDLMTENIVERDLRQMLSNFKNVSIFQ
jgi:hypothetical protein